MKFYLRTGISRRAAGLPGLLCCSLSCLVLLPAQAQAQAAPGEAAALPEVVVTAERRSTVLSKTASALAVIDQDDIERKGIMDLHDIVGVVAGVTVPNGFSNMPQAVAIRGVGASLPAMSQAVGIYLDDVPLIRGYATALWDLPGIERIEVLRGPQGTLYGQNASAGAVKFVSRDPGGVPQAWLAAAAGNLGTLETRGYLNGNLGDGVDGSLAFSRRTNDGFAYNATRDQQVNKLDVAQFQAKLRWRQPGGLDAVLALDGAQDRSDTNTGNYPLNTPRAAPRVTFFSGDIGAFKRNAGGISLKLEDRLAPQLNLRSITSLRGYRDDPTVVDNGGLEIQRAGLTQKVTQHAFSQELQLQGSAHGFNWTAGAMLVRDQFDFDRYTNQFPLAAKAPIYNEAVTSLRTTDVGVYAQGDYALSERLKLTAGVRAYRTEQTGYNQFWNSNAAQQRGSAVYLAPDLESVKRGALPKLGIDYQASPASFLYASVAQGAKFGGFNRAAQSLASAQVATDPERVTTWEAGSKQRWNGGRVTANFALFYNDYRDYLASLSNTTINGVLVTDAVLVNAARAKTYGADVELGAMLGARTRASLSLEALGSRFDSFRNPTGAAATNYVGHQLPNAPQLSLGADLEHRLPLADGAALTLGLSLSYLRQQYADVANSAALRMPAQNYINLSASYALARHWTWSLRVKNLQDRAYLLLRGQIPPLGVDAGYYNAPRTVLFTARYDF